MIYIVSPGGTREKGGMGRIVDNFTTDLRLNCPELRFEVIDTYGPDHKFHLMPVYFLLATARLFGRLVAGKVQLIHIHMAEYGSVLRKGILIGLASLFRVPVVLHLHGGRFPKHYQNAGPVMRWAIRRIMAMTSEVVVLGEYWRQWVLDSFGASRRVTVLHNAVPGQETLPPRDESGPVRLLFLGRLIPLKGIDVLLDALASEICRNKPWSLTIAGDGDLETYSAQVKALGLEDRVRFTGWLDQAACRRELAQAQVLVQPSLFEGLPMSVLEAMANGLAIVATPVGSVPDAIADDETGLLVPAGDRAAMAEALARVIDGPELRRRLGEGARARFERQFDIAVYRERIIEIYRRNARGWLATASIPEPHHAGGGAPIGPSGARPG